MTTSLTIYQASSRPPAVGLHRHGSKSAATSWYRYVSLPLFLTSLTPVLCSSARIRGWVLADITLDFSQLHLEDTPPTIAAGARGPAQAHPAHAPAPDPIGVDTAALQADTPDNQPATGLVAEGRADAGDATTQTLPERMPLNHGLEPAPKPAVRRRALLTEKQRVVRDAALYLGVSHGDMVERAQLALLFIETNRGELKLRYLAHLTHLVENQRRWSRTSRTKRTRNPTRRPAIGTSSQPVYILACSIPGK